MNFCKLIGLGVAFLGLCIEAVSQDTWQQGVEYHISVSLDDEAHRLIGDWELNYTNHSPQGLEEIWLHLWPNAYKNNQTAFAKQQNARGETDFLFAKPEARGYIDGMMFTVDGETAELEYHPKHPDVARLILPKSLPSGSAITLRTAFIVQLPESFSRLGHVDQQYQITQWYPKPAVYDDEGWHAMPYLDQGEFFSEFGSYEVAITVPKNYVVGATGQLQEQSEIDWLLKKSREPISQVEGDEFPVSAVDTKTITYRLDSIHDFAWFADKRYVVRHDSMSLASGKKVGLWLYFNKSNQEVWQEALSYMEDGIRYYSDRVGEYPYAMASVVDGALSAGAGMEYPTITVLGGDDAFSLEQVIVHELGHNWFYGILASNERVHPWLDEGLNSYYEMRYMEEKYPGLMATQKTPEEAAGQRKLLEQFGLWEYPYFWRNQLGYQVMNSIGADQSLTVGADDYSSLNYGLMVYMKTSVILHWLDRYWGRKKFDRVMHTYYERWKFNHPAPDDFQKAIEEAGGEKLPWLFKGMIGSRLGLDVQLVGSQIEGTERVVEVKQIAGVPGPVPVGLVKDGEVQALQWIKLSKDNPSGTARFLSQEEDEVVVDPYGWLPETNRQNNRMTTLGAFKKIEPFEFQLLATAPQPDKTLLQYVPLLGANYHDGFMLGLGVYNNTLPEKRINFALFPQFGFRSRTLTGSYRVQLYPFQELVASQRVALQFRGQRYSSAQRHSIRLVLDHMPNRRSNPVYHRLILAGHNLEAPTPGDSLGAVPFTPLLGSTNVLEIQSQIWQGSALLEWKNNARSWRSDDVLRLENTVEAAFTLPKEGRIVLRGYAAWQQAVSDAGNVPANQRLYLDGGRDFLMENYLFDRRGASQNLMAYQRQTINQQGGFKGPIAVSSQNWLAALNLEVDIPGAYGFGIFADLGFTDSVVGSVYDLGVHYKVFNNVMEIYVPLVGSDILTENTLENIRFTLNLEKLNPYDLMENRLR